MTELELLKSKIDNYNIISFDIFDTLLLRNVEKPIDIFKILELEVKKKYNIDNFSNIRIKSEEKSRTTENNFETSLREIYDYMDIDNNIKKDIMNMEIELEKRFLTANPFIKEIYNYAVKNNKKIYAISDMYLPSDLIKDILKNNGYNIEKVYVSNEYHKHKGNMTLYIEVEEENNLLKNEWLHIGDNYYSDYEMAIKFGINAYHYKKVSERSISLNKESSISSSIIHSIINNFANNGLEVSYFEKFGSLYASSLYFGFANWIYEINKNSDNVYFLARDGYMVKKVFDLIKEYNNNDIYTSYLYTSRRSVQLPLLIFDDKTTAIDTLCSINFKYGKDDKIKDIFNAFDIDTKKYINEIKSFGFNSEEDIVTLDNYTSYKQLISSLYHVFKEKMKDQVDLIEKYLEEEKFNTFKRVNIVDIGWRGSIHNSLTKVCKNEIFGYYLCTSNFVYDNIKYNTRGYLLNYNEPEKLSDVIINNLMMFEFLFSSPEGTLLNYSLENNKIKFILGKEDYSKEVKIMQEISLNLIKEFLKYYEYVKDITPLECLEYYIDFLNKKDYKDVQMISNLSTNTGYSDNKKSFIDKFTKQEIEKDIMNFFEGNINNSMWNNTFLVEGIDNKEEFDEYYNHIKSIYHKKCKRRILHKLTPTYLIEYIKKRVTKR